MSSLMFIVIVVVIGIALLIAISIYSTAKRREALLARYGDPTIVDRIMQRQIWVGQSKAMLVDSIGRPVDVDEKVLKTKRKEIWKYQKTGTNRFALRVTIENEEVVGWDDKR